jgi:hypothetical protein
MQYQVCLAALDTIIKRAFDMLNTAEDNREKLQAMAMFKDAHTTKLELLSNATTIDSALEYIRGKQQQEEEPQLVGDASSDNNNDDDDDTADSNKQTIF